MIEALAADAAKEPLASRIHERSVHGYPKNPCTGALRGLVEGNTELGIVVANDDLWPDAEGRGFAELLRRPLCGRMPRDPDMYEPPRIDTQDEAVAILEIFKRSCGGRAW